MAFMQSMNQPNQARWFRAARLPAVTMEVSSLALGAVISIKLFDLDALLRQHPFGWAELAKLSAAALCGLSSWGFFRFLIGSCQAAWLASRHPGHLLWWLVGGLWVTACAVRLMVQSASPVSGAVSIMFQLGMLLVIPFTAILILAGLRRRERRRADWRAWIGLVVGCTLPIQYLLGLLFLI
jgi:hypothetical protein